MAENLTFKDIEGEAEYPIDLVKTESLEEKKGENSSPVKRSNNDKSTPSSHATNILKARAVARESQEHEFSTEQNQSISGAGTQF